jgi:CelD/BcsL family acetyltransferase involved in cellulose biosynthesis
MELLQSIQQLEAIGGEWDALAAPRGSPVLQHDWMVGCARAFHAGDALRIVTVRRHDRLVAAAPLVAVRRDGVVRLEILGMDTLREPAALLYEDEDALDELLRGIVSLGLPVTLERLDGGSAVSQRVSRHVPRPGLAIIRRTSPTLFVPVRGSWDAYARTLSSRITGNLLRLRKKAARLGPVRVEILAPAPAEAPDLLATLMQIEASGWKGRAGSSMLARRDLRDFFASYAAAAARVGRLRVCLLWFGERIVAGELAVLAHRRWWQLKIGYDEATAEYYPGLQLTFETIRHAFDQRLDAYEFLGSAAEWERRWNPEERAHELIVIYPPSVSGIWGLAVDACSVALHRAAAWASKRRGKAKRI